MAWHEFVFACSLITFLYGIMSIHVHFDYVCVCASMYGLGVCIWACVGYVLGLQHLNWGVDTYAWLWYVVLAGRVIRWRKSSGETAILVFACAVSITVPNTSRRLLVYCTVRVCDPMYARILLLCWLGMVLYICCSSLSVYCCLCVVCYYALSSWTLQL